jgi:hypothetical protein
MTNRIVHVTVAVRSPIPAEADLHVTVVPERLTPGTEVRGRFVGPTCRYAATVEVAYHLRPFLATAPPPAAAAGPGVMLRAVIPEASLWEPESPFLYHGRIELWQEALRRDVVTVRRGLRSLSLGPRGLRLNGRLLALRGHPVGAGATEGDLERLRRQGCNLLLAPVSEPALWDLADQIGFLVIGRLRGAAEAGALPALAEHPSCLGWLVGAGEALPEGLPAGTIGVGVELAEGGPAVVPAGANFALGPPGLLNAVARPRLALLATGGNPGAAVGPGDGSLLGWVG